MSLVHPLPLKASADMLRSGKLDLIGHLETVLDRVEKNEPRLLSLLPVSDRRWRILKEAKHLLEQYSDPQDRPPLFGILVGIKDIINVDGFETRAGSRLPPDAFAGDQASVVSHLRRAGAIILGKTVSTEFAYFQPGETRNPHNPDHTPGGSSSGSAAAVAAGFCHLAIGTQTIASVIRPAAYCGVIGFKPSQGRISNDGIIPFSRTVDQVGFFTQDIDGISSVAAVLCAEWKEECSPDATLRIGIPHRTFLEQSDLLGHFHSILDHLRSHGHDCIRTDLWQDIMQVNEMHNALISYEFYLDHRNLFATYGSLYSVHSRRLYEKGRSQEPKQINKIRTLRDEYSQLMRDYMQRLEIDLWLSPATTTDAPAGFVSTGSPLMSLPWTFSGVPALTIPTGYSVSGLPLGLQLIGAWYKDETLLGHAKTLVRSWQRPV